VLVVGGSLVWWTSRPTVYETRIGERRTVMLADGSRVTLDTASKVAVRLDRNRRSITLAEGQALFDVEHDRSRPFVVTAGDARVTALGTRFDVRLSGQGARVTLVEGRVAVETYGARPKRWTLAPDQRIVTTSKNPAPARTDAASAVSWASGRLTFDNTPVSVAVAEVNRYTMTPIRLEAQAIAQVPVSGVFDTGDVEGFVAALQDLYGVEVRRGQAGGVVLRDPPPTNKYPNPI
jgi:transmembrane sensor